MRATISGLSALLLTLGLSATAEAWSWFQHSSEPVNAVGSDYGSPSWAGGEIGGSEVGGECGGNCGLCGHCFHLCDLFQKIRLHFHAKEDNFTQPYARSPRDYFMVDP